MDTVSRQLLCEYWGCAPALLDDKQAVEGLLRRAAEAAGASVVASAFHALSPRGVAGVLVLSESHFSIHTWPEHGYAAVDFFTCGTCRPERGHEVLAQALRPRAVEVVELERGRREAPGIRTKVHRDGAGGR
ncbi:MAG: adenosylmethionine decarboxylase [Deltaproteobacteria bacterium]|nr:adenosylmethionine decarboxylase [Deltaproteobacteria bacterium]